MSSVREPLSLNGSYNEGGGMLLRTALGMSALTQIPLRVHQVRGGLRKTGLTSEDLAFLRALETIADATVEGDALESSEVIFIPRRAPRPFHQMVDVQGFEKGSVPGNALMLASSLLPVLARAGAYSAFSVHGETFNSNTLTFDAFQQASLALHARQGLVAFTSLTLGGFGYASKGEVRVEVEPSAPNGILWVERGELKRLDATVSYAGVSRDISSRAEEALTGQLTGLGVRPDVHLTEVPCNGSGIHVTVVAHYERGLCSTGLSGQRGTRVEQVVKGAVDPFLEFHASRSTLDPFLADQALMVAALTEEATVFKVQRVTARLQTIAWVIRQFMPIPITILGRAGDEGTVSVRSA